MRGDPDRETFVKSGYWHLEDEPLPAVRIPYLASAAAEPK